MYRKNGLCAGGKQLAEAETGSEFAQFREDSELTFEIEAEREYVQRLKLQREKVSPAVCRSRRCMTSTTACWRRCAPRMSACISRQVLSIRCRDHQQPGVQAEGLPAAHSRGRVAAAAGAAAAGRQRPAEA